MSSPYDKIFKATRLEDARAELALVLPAALVERIDWSTLALASGEFVDDELKHLASDLLYTVRIGGTEAGIYVLYEHQSSVDRTMPLRLLRYMTRIWARFAEDRRGALLPPIVPVVLHHSATGWTAATRFGELLDVNDEVRPALAPFVPDFTFVLDDLAKVEDEALMARALSALGRLTLLLLKRAREVADPVALLQRWLDVLQEAHAAPNGVQAISLVASYIAEVGQGFPEPMQTFFAALGPTAQEAIVTIAEQWRAEERVETETRILLLKFSHDGSAWWPPRLRSESVALPLNSASCGSIAPSLRRPSTRSSIRSASLRRLSATKTICGVRVVRAWPERASRSRSAVHRP